jgi:hypothetical protein
MLHEIMDVSAELIRTLQQNVRNDPTTIDEASLALDRLTRSIARCILLARKLQEARPLRIDTIRPRNQVGPDARAERQAAQTRAPPPTPHTPPQPAPRDAERPEATDRPETTDRPDPVQRLDRLDTLPPGTVPEIIATLSNDLTAIAARVANPPAPRSPKQRQQQRQKQREKQRQKQREKQRQRQRENHRRPTPPNPPQPPNPARAKGSG